MKIDVLWIWGEGIKNIFHAFIKKLDYVNVSASPLVIEIHKAEEVSYTLPSKKNFSVQDTAGSLSP
jgi:hypothetical protein